MLLNVKKLIFIIMLGMSFSVFADVFPPLNSGSLSEPPERVGMHAVIRYVDWKAKTIQLLGIKYTLSTGVDVKGVKGEQLRGNDLKPKMKVAFILGKSATNSTVVKQIKVLKDNVGNESDI